MTAHYITDSWDLASAVLLTRHLPDSHTADNLADALQNAFHEWKLSDKNITGNSDNAKNIVNAWGLLNKLTIGCIGHVLNLAVKKALDVNSVAPVLARARRLVTHFHHSSISSQKLAEKQKLLKVPVRKLPQDVDTRWNSTYDMIVTLLEQQLPICAVLIEGGSKNKAFSLESKDISVMEQLADILKPFKDITVRLSGQSYSTVSVIAPTMHQLVNKVTKQNPEDDKFVKDVKKVLQTDLKQRYQKEDVKHYLLVAAFVDPRFRHLSFLTQEEKEMIHQKVKDEMVAMASTNDATASVPQNAAVAVKQEAESQAATAMEVKQEIVSDILSREEEDIDHQIPTVSADHFAHATSSREVDDDAPPPSKISKMTFNLDDLIVFDSDVQDNSLEQQVKREFDNYLLSQVDSGMLRNDNFNTLVW